jgi:hypothetical protein
VRASSLRISPPVTVALSSNDFTLCSVERAKAIIGVPPEVDVNILRKSIYEKARP